MLCKLHTKVERVSLDDFASIDAARGRYTLGMFASEIIYSLLQDREANPLYQILSNPQMLSGIQPFI